MAAAHVAVNFTAVDETLTPKQQIINVAVQNGLIDMVNDSVSQLDNVHNTVIQTMEGPTQNVKNQTKQAEQAIQDAMVALNDNVGAVDIAGINDTVNNVRIVIIV